mmetsp:Transcript_55781/g.167161  ORF Transcript_55781/g.167161 Transcript_55781/m.167161 type:complete len:245 (-) Transcript_55781:91-825(-)
MVNRVGREGSRTPRTGRAETTPREETRRRERSASSRVSSTPFNRMARPSEKLSGRGKTLRGPPPADLIIASSQMRTVRTGGVAVGEEEASTPYGLRRKRLSSVTSSGSVCRTVRHHRLLRCKDLVCLPRPPHTNRHSSNRVIGRTVRQSPTRLLLSMNPGGLQPQAAALLANSRFRKGQRLEESEATSTVGVFPRFLPRCDDSAIATMQFMGSISPTRSILPPALPMCLGRGRRGGKRGKFVGI